MTNVKAFAAAFVSCLWVLIAFGQSSPDALVRAVEARYNRMSALRAGFVQVYKSDERSAQRQETGTLYLKKPGKMRWEYARPEVKLFISDGKNVYLYVPEDSQVTRMPAKDSGDLRMPLRFLLGRMDLRREFRVTAAADAAPLDPGNPVLRLTPKRADDRFRELLLEADPQNRIRRLRVTESDGAVTEFRLFGEVADPPMDNGLFRFQVPPGVEVIDEKTGR